MRACSSRVTARGFRAGKEKTAPSALGCATGAELTVVAAVGGERRNPAPVAAGATEAAGTRGAGGTAALAAGVSAEVAAGRAAGCGGGCDLSLSTGSIPSVDKSLSAMSSPEGSKSGRFLERFMASAMKASEAELSVWALAGGAGGAEDGAALRKDDRRVRYGMLEEAVMEKLDEDPAMEN